MRSKGATLDKFRLTLEVSASVRARMNRLRDRSDATSITEVLRRALATYEVLLDTNDAGHDIIVRSPEGDSRLVLL